MVNQSKKNNKRNIVIPTGEKSELIKDKNIDFRVLCAISILSNCEDITKEGNNERYCDIEKIKRNSIRMAKKIGMSTKDFIEKTNTILNYENKKYFYQSTATEDEKTIHYINMAYEKGEFTVVPLKIVEDKLLKLTNSQLKLFLTINWICKGKKTQITDSYLLECLGLSKNSREQIRRMSNKLIEKGLLETTVKNGTTNYSSESHHTDKLKKIKYYKIKSQ